MAKKPIQTTNEQVNTPIQMTKEDTDNVQMVNTANTETKNKSYVVLNGNIKVNGKYYTKGQVVTLTQEEAKYFPNQIKLK